MAEDGHVRDAQLVPREEAFAPGVELHKGLRDRVREVLLHPQGVPIAVDVYRLSALSFRAKEESQDRNSREKADQKNKGLGPAHSRPSPKPPLTRRFGV